MNVSSVMEEIRQLPAADWDQVSEFVRSLEKERMMTPEELGKVAQEMVDETDPVKLRFSSADCSRAFTDIRKMPKVRRSDVPHGVIRHLSDRIAEREISVDQLILLTKWLETEPEVPTGNGSSTFPA